MTTLSDTPGEGLAGYCTDCEGKTIIRNGRCGCGSGRVVASPSVASDTAALPSGYEGLAKKLRAATMGFDWRDLPDNALIPAVPLLREAVEAIAALGRGQPVAWHGTWQTRTSKWTEVFETEAQATNWAISKEGAVINPLFFSATPPAPQPALALIEDSTKAQALELADTLENKPWIDVGREPVIKVLRAISQGEAAQPAAEGWIDWPGLKQPVDDDTIIGGMTTDEAIEYANRAVAISEGVKRLSSELAASREREMALERERDEARGNLDIAISMARMVEARAATAEADVANLKAWQAEQVALIDDTRALIAGLNADKKAAEAEVRRLREALAWAENADPQLVEAIRDRALADANTQGGKNEAE